MVSTKAFISGVFQLKPAERFIRALFIVFALIILVLFFYTAVSADSEIVLNSDNGYYYQHIDTHMEWEDARKHCEQLGGHLATITSQEENQCNVYTICEWDAYVPDSIKRSTYGPKIVDVTEKAFSVIWTNAPGSDPWITLYKSGDYELAYTPLELSRKGIKIRVDSSDEARSYGIMKVDVFGLVDNSTYYFSPSVNEHTMDFRGHVTTLGKSASADNAILHKAIYKADGVNAATGVYVLLEIYDNKGNVLSYSPISGAVGEGMPEQFKQYAHVNLQNLLRNPFCKNHFPLRINSDGTEMIELTVIRGTQDVMNQNPGMDYFIIEAECMDLVTTMVNENICQPLTMENVHFKKGLNTFSLQGDLGNGLYTSAQLFEDITNKGGDVLAIYGYNEAWPSKWKITQFSRKGYIDSFDIVKGSGCMIYMREDMPEGAHLAFYTKPKPAQSTFIPHSLALISIPQVPLGYESENLIQDLENSGAEVIAIYGYDENWPSKWKITQAARIGYRNSFPIIAGRAYIVQIGAINNGYDIIENWSPDGL